MKLVRALALMVAAILLLMPGVAEVTAPGELPLSSETIKLTVGIPQSSVVEDWETNRYTKLLEDTLNVDLTFVELPPSGKEFDQKLELMMIDGSDLPDVIIGGFDANTLVKYAQMGRIIPVTEYYDTLSYFIDETCGICTMSKDEMLKYVTSYDGEVYGVFRISESLNNMYSGARMMIYKPWLDVLGLDMPETTEDFINVLKAFRDGDPNQNGENDEIPLMSYSGVVNTNLMRALINPFIYCQANYYYVEDGEVKLAAMQDEWKEALAFVKELMDENLLSPLSLTQDKSQLTALMSQEPTIVGCVANISTTNLPASDARRNEYYTVEPLTGPEGVKQTTKTPTLPSLAMIITSKCENPEAAFRMGDFMCREDVSLFNRFGEEGTEWVYLDVPGDSDYEPLGYAGDIAQLINPWGSLQNVYWANVGPQIMNGTFIFRVAAAAKSNNYTGNRRIAEGLVKEIELANPDYVAGLVYTEEEQKVINNYLKPINGYIEESFAQFITGQLDLENDWEGYLAEFDKLNTEEYLEAVNSAYERQQAK